MNHRSFKLVFGYMPEIDALSPAARRLGLERRFAVVINSYRPDRGPDSYVDRALFEALLKGLQDDWKADDIVRHGENQNETWDLWKDGRVICHVESESYSRTGGPTPYNDDDAFSFYLADYQPAAIEQRIRQVAQKENAALEEIIQGEPAPQISRYTKIKRWIRGTGLI